MIRLSAFADEISPDLDEQITVLSSEHIHFVDLRSVWDIYEALRPWLGYVHVKDARADGSIVAAGEGVTHWPELLQRLRADGYDGFLSLEPHLASAGKYQGFSGPNLFRLASQALQRMLQAMGWEYA